MTEFTPIDPAGLSDRELLEAAVRGVNRTHECVHQFQTRQERENEDARLKRHALANVVADLQGDVRQVTRGLGTVTSDLADVKLDRTIDSGRIEKLAKMFGAEAWAPEDKRVRPTGARASRLASAGLASAIIIAAALLVTNAQTYGFFRELFKAADHYLVTAAKK